MVSGHVTPLSNGISSKHLHTCVNPFRVISCAHLAFTELPAKILLENFQIKKLWELMICIRVPG